VSSKQRNLRKNNAPSLANGTKAGSTDRNSPDERSPVQQKPSLAESTSQKSLKVISRETQRQVPSKQPGGKKMSSLIQSQQQANNFDSQPLSIQGESTNKTAAARKAAQVKSQNRANTQITHTSVVSPTSVQNKESMLSNIRRDSESQGEYDADEFEKEDLVQIREP